MHKKFLNYHPAQKDLNAPKIFEMHHNENFEFTKRF